jgi:hypothetical protein
MSKYQGVKVFQSFLHDPSPENCRPPWWVILFAIFFLMYMIGG